MLKFHWPGLAYLANFWVKGSHRDQCFMWTRCQSSDSKEEIGEAFWVGNASFLIVGLLKASNKLVYVVTLQEGYTVFPKLM